eukprot:scaffold4993_cov211-Prasinococcus_capsulatus_cf.AAC.2
MLVLARPSAVSSGGPTGASPEWLRAEMLLRRRTTSCRVARRRASRRRASRRRASCVAARRAQGRASACVRGGPPASAPRAARPRHEVAEWSGGLLAGCLLARTRAASAAGGSSGRGRSVTSGCSASPTCSGCTYVSTPRSTALTAYRELARPAWWAQAPQRLSLYDSRGLRPLCKSSSGAVWRRAHAPLPSPTPPRSS